MSVLQLIYCNRFFGLLWMFNGASGFVLRTLTTILAGGVSHCAAAFLPSLMEDPSRPRSRCASFPVKRRDRSKRLVRLEFASSALAIERHLSTPISSVRLLFSLLPSP